MTLILEPEKPEPECGQFRIRSFFAWYPVKVGPHVKWLELVSVLEAYTCFLSVDSWYGEETWEWKKKKFL